MRSYRPFKFVLIAALLIFSVSVQAEEDPQYELTLSTSQKWILGLTGAAFIGIATSEHSDYHMDNNRHLAVLGAGAIAFLTVTLFESTNKSKKLSIAATGEGMGLNFNTHF